ncbi:MAG: hypothetical protein ABIC40_05115 [bacterium]
MKYHKLNKFTLGIIFFMLFAACLSHTSLLGCAGKNSDATDENSDANGAAFFNRTDNHSNEEPSDWQPVADNILTEIHNSHKALGFQFVSCELSKSGARAVKCVLSSRDGIDDAKQLLDGFYLMHESFPRLDRYLVKIDVASQMESQTSYENLMALLKAGYTFEIPSNSAASYLHYLTDGNENSSNPIPSVEMSK